MTSSETIIKSTGHPWQLVNFKELWKYRELVYFLSLRDIKVKYKQAFFGVAWVVVPPVFNMLIYKFLLGTIAQINSNGVPYEVFSFVALVPWAYFSGALSRGSLSLAGSGALFSKVYFPRLIIPIASVLSGLVDYLISFFCLFFLLAYFGYYPNWAWVLKLPLLTLWLSVLGAGVSFWLGALNVKYRDVGHILPFLTQVLMFVSPIVYPADLVPARFQGFVKWNPLYGIINEYRNVFFQSPSDSTSVWLSLLVTVIIFVSGTWYFAKTERSFADIV